MTQMIRTRMAANTSMQLTVPQLMLGVHLASLREPRLEKFPVGGGANKLKVHLRIRDLAALPVLAEGVEEVPRARSFETIIQSPGRC